MIRRWLRNLIRPQMPYALTEHFVRLAHPAMQWRGYGYWVASADEDRELHEGTGAAFSEGGPNPRPSWRGVGS